MFIPPIVQALLTVPHEAAADLRCRISRVSLGPIVAGYETVTFTLDGEDYEGVLRGRNLCSVPGLNPEADQSIALRVLLDGDAHPISL